MLTTTLTFSQSQTVTQTLNSSATFNEFARSLGVSIGYRGQGAPCRWNSLSVNSKAGVRFVGEFFEIPTNLPSKALIDFYLMNDAQLSRWGQGTTCKATDVLVKAEGVSDSKIDFVFPADGRYTFVFVNYDYSTGIQVLWMTQPQIYSATTATLTNTVTTSLSSTFLLASTIEVPFLQANASWLLLLVLVAIVVAVAVVFLVFRMRGRKRPKRTKRKRGRRT